MKRSFSNARASRLWLRFSSAAKIAVLFGLTTYSPAQAQPYQDIASLHESVRLAMARNGSAQGQFELGLDSGLRLPKCSEPLVASRHARTSIEISCPGGWRIYAPLRIHHVGSVVVTVRPVTKGTALSDELLRVEQRDLSRLPAEAFDELEKLRGLQSTRSLAAGTPLTHRDVEPATRIRRGDSVVLIARRNGIEVRVAGLAMADAGVNEWLSVRNLSSNRIVQGVLVESGEVECR